MAKTHSWKAGAPVSESGSLLTPEGRLVTGNSLWFVLSILSAQVLILGAIGQYLVGVLNEAESGGTANFIFGVLIVGGGAMALAFGLTDTYFRYQTDRELKEAGYTPENYIAEHMAIQDQR